MLRVTVWNENVHENFGWLGGERYLAVPEKRAARFRTQNERVNQVHPSGLHGTLAEIVRTMEEKPEVRTAVLQEESCGLTDEVLESTDVLIWWGHCAHDEVPDELVEKIYRRVLKGMGLIVLHSGHYSKIFRRLMGTSCDLRFRDDVYERLFCIHPTHPIAQGIPESFELGTEECYGERFDIPEPDELIFLGWYDIGEVFRSGCTWRRGYGKIFYFQPGHETNQAFQNPHVRRILQNAVRWAKPDCFRPTLGSEPITETLEEKRGKAR